MIGPLRNLTNRLRFGADAPRRAERIWVRPRDVTQILKRGDSALYNFRRGDSGRVLDGDWDHDVRPYLASVKLRACDLHFRQGVPWKDTGVYDHMMRMIDKKGRFDSCHTLEDVIARYEGMDVLMDKIRREGFRSAAAPDAAHPTEPGGVFMHIGRDGQPIFGSIGNHRMAIAHALDLPVIPAQLGVIHRIAFDQGALERYRRPPQDAG